MKTFLFSILGLFLSAFLFAQSSITFTAGADADQVLMGEYFKVTFTLKGGNGSNFSPPTFKNFRILGGPNQSMRTSIANGKVDKSLSYSYTLQPRQPGNFIIGSARIISNGKTLETRTLSIHVLKSNPDQNSAYAEIKEGMDIFIRAEIDTNVAYLGQQILLDYKLFTRKNISQFDILFESDYAGFYKRDVPRFRSQVKREIINGVQYTTKVLKRVALYPQKSGSYTIEPMTMRLSLQSGDPFGGFFFNRRSKPLNKQTNACTINVQSLPGDKPEGFIGAVGHLKMFASTSTRMMSTDDALSLFLTFEGDGDMKRVTAPSLDLSENFELFDSKTAKEELIRADEKLIFRKKFEYLIVPKNPGIHSIVPECFYFNTDSSSYELIRLAPVKINITQGSLTKSGTAKSGTVNTSERDINFIKTKLPSFYTTGRSKNSFILLVLWLIPFLGLGIIVLKKWNKRQIMRMDPGLLRKKQAKKTAISQLQKAKEEISGKSGQYYRAISAALIGYASDRLQISREELSKKKIRHNLTNAGARNETINNLISLLHKAEIALYAPVANSDDRQELYEKAVELISNLDTELTKQNNRSQESGNG